ncbi:2778_t:CDS:1, partial [Racocetra fulgida]
RNKQIVDLRAEVQEKVSTIKKLEDDNQNYRELLIKLRKDFESCKHLLQREREGKIMLQHDLSVQDQQITFLEKKNTELKDEASKYQLALGNATNFRFNDDDPNNTMRLKSDIENLQNMIEDYVTNLKTGVEINFENVNKLLQTYGSQTTINSDDPNRRLIKAVLQHHVLKEILSYTDVCPENDCTETCTLESNIIRKTDDLIGLINRFSNERVGTDDVTRVASIKLRQQVYVILGNRGYANVYEKNIENKQHPFLTIFQKRLNDSMNQYRAVNDPKKKTMVERMAEKLIQEVVRVFKFRFKVQEPMIEIYWINYSTKIMD